MSLLAFVRDVNAMSPLGHKRTLEQLRNDVALRRHLILPEKGFEVGPEGNIARAYIRRLRPPTARVT